MYDDRQMIRTLARSLIGAQLFILLLVFSGGMLAQSVPAGTAYRLQPRYDGDWWLSANPGERSGLLNGVADCMTWEAHKKGYSETPEQLESKLTTFYSNYPASSRVGLLEAWRRVTTADEQRSPAGDGEIWSNAHWYLDGRWWGQIGLSEQTGFVEGYLWCVRTQVSSPHAAYSQPASVYCAKISAFIAAHPKLNKEPVATTLARFKDPGSR